MALDGECIPEHRVAIQVEIDQELLDHLEAEAEKQGTDVSTYVRWCIRTGLYLDDLNLFIRDREGETD